MLALYATLSLLTASPNVALVKRTTEGVPQEAVALVMGQLVQVLEHEGFVIVPAETTCKDVHCLGEVAAKSKAALAVAVTLIRGRRDLTLGLQAIDPEQVQLALSTFSLPLKGEPLPPGCTEFFRTLKEALSVPVAKKVEDAPRIVQLVPTPVATPDLVRTNGDRGLLHLTAVTTIGSGALGVGLLIASVMVKDQLSTNLKLDSKTMQVSLISRDEAHREANLSNGLATGAIIAAAVAGVAAVTTGVLWLREDRSDSPSSDP